MPPGVGRDTAIRRSRPLGREQAFALAAQLAGEGIEVLIASDLARSAQTAAILGARWGLVPQHDARLREIDIGAWTGLTREQIVERDAELLAALRSRAISRRGRAAARRVSRSGRACARRRWSWRRRIAAGASPLVTHLGVIRALVPGAEPANAGWLRLEGARARGASVSARSSA